jgi:hypothetical protein
MRMSVVLAAFALCAPLGAGDKAKSGAQTGYAVPPFDVLDITGPNAGNKALCYR